MQVLIWSYSLRPRQRQLNNAWYNFQFVICPISLIIFSSAWNDPNQVQFLKYIAHLPPLIINLNLHPLSSVISLHNNRLDRTLRVIHPQFTFDQTRTTALIATNWYACHRAAPPSPLTNPTAKSWINEHLLSSSPTTKCFTIVTWSSVIPDVIKMFIVKV